MWFVMSHCAKSLMKVGSSPPDTSSLLPEYGCPALPGPSPRPHSPMATCFPFWDAKDVSQFSP